MPSVCALAMQAALAAHTSVSAYRVGAHFTKLNSELASKDDSHASELADSVPSPRWPQLVPLLEFMPPRIQWDANLGYCGETSFIQAGLLYGQYLSQYKVREILSGHQSDEEDQLLVGANDQSAADLLKLTYVAFEPTENTSAWLEWIKPHVLAGHPVTVGVLTNFDPLFFGQAEEALAPGQPEYDHIVNVVDITGDGDNTTITFYDHGLWSMCRPDGAWGIDKHRDSTFSYNVKDITKSRKEANLASTAYSIVDASEPKFAIAITGPANLNEGHDNIVSIQASPAEEKPVMEEESDDKPVASSMLLSVTVYGLVQHTHYSLYMYNSMESVPEKGSNPATLAANTWNFIATGTKHALQVPIKSDEVAVFRCYKHREEHGDGAWLFANP